MSLELLCRRWEKPTLLSGRPCTGTYFNKLHISVIPILKLNIAELEGQRVKINECFNSDKH